MPDLMLRLEPGRLPGQHGATAALVTAIRDAARTGRLRAGDRLPSSRALAADLGVSRGVVTNAYDHLIADGLLSARHGAGTYLTAAVTTTTPSDGADAGTDPGGTGPATGAGAGADHRPPGRPRYDLATGAPDLRTFPRAAWVAAVRRALATASHTELGYGDVAGSARCRAALAAYLNRVRGTAATPELLHVTSGVAQAEALLVRVLAEAGHRRLAVEDPSHAAHRDLLTASGLELVPVPVDEHGVDVAALAASDARALLCSPAHQYPTGAVMAPHRRAQLLAWARERDGIVIEDDYDAEFRYDREPVAALHSLDPGRVVLLGSVSKALAPGLRLGWALLPAWLAEPMRAQRRRLDLGNPVIDQLTFTELLTTGRYERHLHAERRRYRRRRDAFVAALRAAWPGARVRGVAAGLHLLLELPAGTDERRVVERAAALGVAVEPVGPMRWRPGPAALVIGFARIGAGALTEAAALLAEAGRSRGLAVG
jgi:GntR family transcriptional regulator/MocR family aminotransferase